jgi:hypothetical protein
MELARDRANANLERVEYRYELVHRDILDVDAGYGQVGCVARSLTIDLAGRQCPFACA